MKIVVLFHANETNPTRYVIHHVAEAWRSDGHVVDYVMGTRRFVPADVALLHVDLSVVPEEYVAFARGYPRVLNDGIRDIRKSTVSGALVRRDDAWTGPVIVKSDLNFGGMPEQALRVGRLERRFRVLRELRWSFDTRFRPHRRAVGNIEYPIFEYPDEVPDHVWTDPRLVVERFLPEVEDGRFHLRIAQVLGPRWKCTRLSSDHQVIKARRSLASEDVDAHPVVFEWQRRFGLDYGKIDYVVHDGEPILLDVNKTVGATSDYRDDAALAANRRYLAEGLYELLDGPAVSRSTAHNT